MIKVVSSRKSKIPLEQYLHKIYKQEEAKQVEQLIENPDNTEGINPKNLNRYLGIAKRELKKQEIQEEHSRRSL